MRFFKREYAQAIAALAAAIVNNKSIPGVLSSQSPEQISALINNITKMNKHSDFRKMRLLAKAKAFEPVDAISLCYTRASST